MPKSKVKLAIHLNLLKPQSNPEKIPLKLIRWLLSSGRYIFIFVEALVLIAFIARFKLDADLQAKKEAIEEQIAYIESLRPYEILIRNVQLKLSTISNIQKGTPEWALILKKVADQIPVSSKITTIGMEKEGDAAVVHIVGETQINSDVRSFVAGLKGDATFSNVNIMNIGLEEGIVKFTIDAQARTVNFEGKNQ